MSEFIVSGKIFVKKLFLFIGIGFLLSMTVSGCSRENGKQDRVLYFYSDANTIGFYLVKEDGSQIGAKDALGTRVRFLCNREGIWYYTDEILWITEERKLCRGWIQKGKVKTEELAELSEAACSSLEETEATIHFYEGKIYLKGKIPHSFSYELYITCLDPETGETEEVWREIKEDGFLWDGVSGDKHYQIDAQNIYVQNCEDWLKPQETSICLGDWKKFCRERCRQACQKKREELQNELMSEESENGQEKEMYLDLLLKLPEEGWLTCIDKYCLMDIGNEGRRVIWWYDYENGEELGVFLYEGSQTAQIRDGQIYYAGRDGQVHVSSLDGIEQIYDCDGRAIGGVQFLRDGFLADVIVEGGGYGEKYFWYP